MEGSELEKHKNQKTKTVSLRLSAKCARSSFLDLQASGGISALLGC